MPRCAVPAGLSPARGGSGALRTRNLRRGRNLFRRHAHLRERHVRIDGGNRKNRIGSRGREGLALGEAGAAHRDNEGSGRVGPGLRRPPHGADRRGLARIPEGADGGELNLCYAAGGADAEGLKLAIGAAAGQQGEDDEKEQQQKGKGARCFS
jgi:hypothetical protein